MIRTVVVDDHEVVREGLVAALAADQDIRIVGQAATGVDAVAEVLRLKPDVALIDLRLPDVSGHVLCAELRRKCPRTAIVVLSTYLNESAVRDALAAGASAYVSKAAGIAELRAAIRRVGAGPVERPLDSSQIVEQLKGLIAVRSADGLSSHQRRILELAQEGLTDAEIGKRMCISRSTVRFHLQKLKAQLGARSKTELVVLALKAGIINAPEDEAEPPR